LYYSHIETGEYLISEFSWSMLFVLAQLLPEKDNRVEENRKTISSALPIRVPWKMAPMVGLAVRATIGMSHYIKDI
jgi:hypothetical protein